VHECRAPVVDASPGSMRRCRPGPRIGASVCAQARSTPVATRRRVR
jgi:hypothetical protein